MCKEMTKHPSVPNMYSQITDIYSLIFKLPFNCFFTFAVSAFCSPLLKLYDVY